MTKRTKKSVYQEPRITRIKLDPEQAILQQCVVGGIYFDSGTAGSICTSTAGAGTLTRFTCGTSVRGQSTLTGNFTLGGSPSAQPS